MRNVVILEMALPKRGWQAPRPIACTLGLNIEYKMPHRTNTHRNTIIRQGNQSLSKLQSLQTAINSS